MRPDLGIRDSTVKSRQNFVHLLVLVRANHDPRDARGISPHLRLHLFRPTHP
jgi:hypothetical protein